MKTSSRQLLLISIGLLCLSEPAMAERRGAGFRSGMAARGGARTSVTARPTAGNFNYNRSNTNVNRPIQVDGVTYQQCGSTWYQPQFSCTTTTHVVVSPPQ